MGGTRARVRAARVLQRAWRRVAAFDRDVADALAWCRSTYAAVPLDIAALNDLVELDLWPDGNPSVFEPAQEGCANRHRSSGWWRAAPDGRPIGVLTLAVVRAATAACRFGMSDVSQWEPGGEAREYSLRDVVPGVDEALPAQLVAALEARLATFFEKWEGFLEVPWAFRALVRCLMVVGAARLAGELPAYQPGRDPSLYEW